MQKSLCSPLNNFCNNKVLNSSSKIFSFPNNMDTPNSFSNVNERYELNEGKKKQYRFQLNSLFKQLIGSKKFAANKKNNSLHHRFRI